MAPQISVNFLFGSKRNFKIGQFYMYLNLNRKVLVALATFNKNDPYSLFTFWRLDDLICVIRRNVISLD